MISLNGLASGLDTNSIINQLMQIERQPLVKLQSRKTDLANQQAVFRSINTKLAALKTAAQDLMYSSTLLVGKATSSDTTAVDATASGSVSPGTYVVEVVKTAKSHVVGSGTFSANADASALSGQTFRIYAPGSSSPLTVTASGATYRDVLNNVKDQINAANAGISASVVETTPGQLQLVLTSKNTGVDYRMKFGSAADGNRTVLEDNGGLLASLGISDTDANGEIDTANVVRQADDAEFKVNGLTLTRSGNTISDVVQGVTLRLLKDNATATVTVGWDADKAAAKVENFVKAYNDVVSTIRDNLEKGKPLQGDASLIALDNLLYSTVTGLVDSAPYQALSQIGLEIDRGITSGSLMTGTITFDKEKFKSAFEQNPNAVVELFRKDYDDPGTPENDTALDGIARKLQAALAPWTDFVNGVLNIRIRGYDEEIRLVDRRVEALNERLANKEQQLRRQFTAMETALAKLQSQQAWLMSQIASLQNFG